MRRIETGAVPREDAQAEENRVTKSLAGMAVALSLVVGSLFLIQMLEVKAHVEDCLMAGRANCDVVAAQAR